jgi:hypothetical protein
MRSCRAPADEGARRGGALGAISYLEGYYVHDLTSRAFATDRWRETDNATPLVYSAATSSTCCAGSPARRIVEVFAGGESSRVSRLPEST